MINLRNVLAKNMRRFATKNLNEQTDIKLDTIKPPEPGPKSPGEDEVLKRQGVNYLYHKREDGKWIIKTKYGTQKDYVLPTYAPQIYVNTQKSDIRNPKDPNRGIGYDSKADAQQQLKDIFTKTTTTSTNVDNLSKEKQIDYYQKKLDQLKK